MSQNSLINSFLNKVGWQSSVTITYVSVAFFQSIILARFLGIYDFGIYASFFGLSVIISQLLDPRFLDFLIKFLSRFEIERNQKHSYTLVQFSWLFSSLLIIVVAIISALIGPIIINLFFTGSGNESNYLLPLSLITTLTSTHFFTIFQAVYRAKDLIKYLSVFSVLFHISRIVALILYFLFFEETLYGVFFTLALISIFFIVIMCILLMQLYSSEGVDVMTFPVEGVKLGEEVKIIKSLYFTSLASIPQKELDILMLSFFSRPETVGIYRMAKNFAIALWALVDGIVLIIFPEIVKLAKKEDWAKLKELIRRISIFGLAVAFITLFLAYILLPYFISIFLTDEYSGAFILSLIIFSGAIIWLPLTWVYPYSVSVTFSNLIPISTLISGILSLVLYLIIVPIMDSYGASLVYSISPGIASTVLLTGLLFTGKLKFLLK